LTEIAKAAMHDEAQLMKWRVESGRIAAHLKGIDEWGGRESIVAGIVFDDAVVRVPIDVSMIRRINTEALAEFIFNAALSKITDHRAAGESAAAHEATGMECGHAAPQVPEGPTSSFSSRGTPEPAAAAVSERCWRRIPPDFAEQCPHDATGGIRLKLFPALTIQKRYGKRDMLALILDLPVCADCFKLMTPIEVLSNLGPAQWQAFSKVAQQRNNGVLPIKEQSEIEHLPFEDREYTMLRLELAKKRAAA
jgi:hypothetical protein